MHRQTYWKDEHEWVCTKHLPSLHLPASMGTCLFEGCNSVRPKRPTSLNPSANTTQTSTTTPIATVPKPTATKVAVTTVEKTPTINHAKDQSKETAIEEALEDICSWFKCDKGENGGPAKNKTKSKYCSKDCSNKNARFRHKQRKKTDGKE